MEMLVDVIFGNRRKRREAEVLSKIKAVDYASIVTILGMSFLLGRTALFSSMFPCGIAMTAALFGRGKISVYALPFIVIGTLSNFGAGYDIWGDIMVTIACGTVFFILSRYKLSALVRGTIAAAITVIIKSVYYLTASLVFLYDIFMLAAEVLVILGLVMVLDSFLRLQSGEEAGRKSTAEGIVTMAVVFTLLLSGAFSGITEPISLVNAGALLFILFAGSQMGIMEGGIAGVGTGIAVMLASSGSPSIIGIFAFAGMTAGYFKGKSKYAAGVCFSGICLFFGLVKGYPELYLSVYDPMLAALVFMAMPKRLINKLNFLLAKIRQDDASHGMLSEKKMEATIDGYREIFERLSLIYSRPTETGAAEAVSAAGKSIMSCQFKGMSKALERIKEELESNALALEPAEEKYQVRIGASRYARSERISGDSYLCTPVRKGQYMIALSDGMGRGERASQESALAVNTLRDMLQAGFDVELALKTINSILLYKSTEEIFSTMDMGLFNLCNGKIKFFKIGAAATFIKRGDQVDVLKVSALPMGIVDQIKIDDVEIQGRSGDEIIIVSDGITDADRQDGELEWLKEAISAIKSKDPQTMADLIVGKAIERYGLKEKDDMTVITAVLN